MKVKAIKNFFLYTGERIDINSEYEMADDIALDLIKGSFVIESKEEKKTEKKTTTRKKKVEE